MNTLINAMSEPVAAATARIPVPASGHAETLHHFMTEGEGEAIVLPQACPSAPGTRRDVAAIEAKASAMTEACLNPLCPYGMLMQKKQASLTIA